MASKISIFLKKLRKNYLLSITDRAKLSEVFSTSVSRLKLLMVLLLTFIVLLTLVVLLLVISPLRYSMPGYPSRIQWKSIYENAQMIDSLEHQINLRDEYLTKIQAVIKGEVIDETIDTSMIIPEVKLQPMQDDSIFNQLIGAEQFRFTFDSNSESEDITRINFYKPISGYVINRFNASPGHKGVDVVGKLHTNVCAVLEGNVIFAEWSVTTGHVLVIQHKHHLISVYKHNSEILVKQGDKVAVGQVIAIMGDEGELSSGPHLHFELWHNGNALDPQNYINF